MRSPKKIQAARCRILASELKSPYTTPDGEIKFTLWAAEDLCDDEGQEDYLPPEVETVLEIAVVRASRQGAGHGTRLMKAFLNEPAVQAVDAIFLDPSPLMTSMDGKKPEGDEEDILDNLQRFYSRFGFRNRSVHARMWIFQRQPIPINQYPV